MRGAERRMLVVKVGGTGGVGHETLLDEVEELVEGRVPLVLVHGGSAETSRLQRRLGDEPLMVSSPSGAESRYTDEEALDAFVMACAGKVNTDLVAGLNGRGVTAVGLSGVDGGLCSGPLKEAIKVRRDGRTFLMRGNRSGRVETVRPGVLHALLGAQMLPVVGPPALSYSGGPMNTDADRMAAAIAVAIGADRVVFLTDRAGLLEDPDDNSTLIRSLEGSREIEGAGRWARGRMVAKLRAAEEAVDGGVESAIIADAGVVSPIRSAMEGYGTVITGGDRRGVEVS